MLVTSLLAWLAPAEPRRAAFLRGDPDELSRLYREHAPSVERFIRRGFSFSSGGRLSFYRGCDCAFDVDDMLTETFINAFKDAARAQFDPSLRFDYLLGIAKNVVLARLRKKRDVLLPDGDVQDLRESHEEPEPGPEAALLRSELRTLCERFAVTLEGAGAREQVATRRFFERRFLHGDKTVTAARHAGLTRQRARTLERHLRDEIVRYLRAAGYLPTTSVTSEGEP